MGRRRPGQYERTQFFGINFNDSKICHDQKDFLESFEMQNVDIGLSGIRTRQGRLKINSSAVPSNIHSLDWFRDKNNNSHLMIGAGSVIYDAGDASATAVSSLTGLTPDTKSNNTSFKGFHWFANGVDTPKKYDGTTWTLAAIPKPAAVPTTADGGGGILSGDYLYTYVYVYVNVALGYESESAIPGYSTLLTVVNKQIDVDVVADPTGTATYIRIYRRSSTTVSPKLVVQLSNTTATYTDNIAEAALGNYLTGGNEGNVNVNFKGLTAWNNRLWGWYDEYVYFTREHEPEKWWTFESDFNPFIIDPVNNENVVACFPFGSVLVIFTENRMQYIVGDAEPFTRVVIPGNFGCISKRSIRECGPFLMWTGKDGIYKWDGVTIPQMVSRPVNNDLGEADRGILDTVTNSLAIGASLYDPKTHKYWNTTPVGSQLLNSRTHYYDFEMKNENKLSQWGMYTFGFVDAVVTHDGRIITASGADGYYRFEKTGTDDDGTTIDAYYETRQWDFGSRSWDKRFFRFAASAFTTGDPVTFSIKCWDPRVGLRQDDISLSSPVGAVWASGAGVPTGAGVWDSSTCGGSIMDYRYNSFKQFCMGTYISFKIAMNKDAVFDGFTAEYIVLRGAKV